MSRYRLIQRARNSNVLSFETCQHCKHAINQTKGKSYLIITGYQRTRFYCSAFCCYANEIGIENVTCYKCKLITDNNIRFKMKYREVYITVNSCDKCYHKESTKLEAHLLKCLHKVLGEKK